MREVLQATRHRPGEAASSLASILELLFGIAALPVLLASAYLVMLTLASRKPRVPTYPSPHLRFDVVVPAHDEEGGIAATVASLLALDYPASLRRVFVVADNCTDATAAARSQPPAPQSSSGRTPSCAARATPSARLRVEPRAAGSPTRSWWSTPDSEVSPNLLRAFAARLEAGAPAIQAFYGGPQPRRLVAHPPDGGGARRVPRCSAHWAASASAVSVGLRGNGMCFSAALLREVPHDAFSIVEDLEYGIRLGQAGHRGPLRGRGDGPERDGLERQASRSQRHRWEGGRWRLARALGPRLTAPGGSRAGRGVARPRPRPPLPAALRPGRGRVGGDRGRGRRPWGGGRAAAGPLDVGSERPWARAPRRARLVRLADGPPRAGQPVLGAGLPGLEGGARPDAPAAPPAGLDPDSARETRGARGTAP